MTFICVYIYIYSIYMSNWQRAPPGASTRTVLFPRPRAEFHCGWRWTCLWYCMQRNTWRGDFTLLLNCKFKNCPSCGFRLQWIDDARWCQENTLRKSECHPIWSPSDRLRNLLPSGTAWQSTMWPTSSNPAWRDLQLPHPSWLWPPCRRRTNSIPHTCP